MLQINQSFLAGLTLPLAEVAPFVIHWGYQASLFFIRENKKAYSEEMSGAIYRLQLGWKVLGTRWGYAGMGAH